MRHLTRQINSDCKKLLSFVALLFAAGDLQRYGLKFASVLQNFTSHTLIYTLLSEKQLPHIVFIT